MLETCGYTEAHLPFAGITLFRFNGCDLSLSDVRKSTPGYLINPIYRFYDFRKTGKIVSAKLMIEKLNLL